MILRNKNSYALIIFWTAFINTLIISPGFNKDGMIIPKLMVIFSTSMFLFPMLIKNRKLLIENKLSLFLVGVSILIIIQSVLVIIISTAPLEQQIFGRTGRGLGFITVVSILICLIASSLFIEKYNLNKLVSYLILSSLISSLYALAQSYGYDFLKWESRTNGVIGTLGNPNFQSTLSAMVLVPTILYNWGKAQKYYLNIPIFLIFALVIIRTQSIQGIVAGSFSILIAFLLFLWFRNKYFFYFISVFGMFAAGFAISGMLNKGPLANFLYKVSVESRGDFWRSAFSTANANPIFGVGLDSFGDYSLYYRDQIAANHSFAEYTDNAHNYFLEYAATGGYPLAILNLLVVLIVLYSFIKLIISSSKFDPLVTSLFCSWISFQMVTVISPGNLVNMYWNAVLSGAIISIAKVFFYSNRSQSDNSNLQIRYKMSSSFIAALIGLILLLPLFNTDRLQLRGMQNSDANLVIKASKRFPESTVRYSLIGRELLESGLYPQALDLAKSAVQFNPNSPGLWALILVNPQASMEERLNAKSKVLELDPLNKIVRDYVP